MTRTEEIRARVEKATPGPWMPCEREAENPYIFVEDGATPGKRGHPLGMLFWPCHHPTPEATRAAEVLTYDTADFIAHARSDIPYLLEENKRLREAITDLLMSADASWYERNAGHDWREAYDRAAALTPAPAQEEQ